MYVYILCITSTVTILQSVLKHTCIYMFAYKYIYITIDLQSDNSFNLFSSMYAYINLHESNFFQSVIKHECIFLLKMCTRIHLCVCKYDIYIYIYIYIYIHINIQIYIYIHIYICTCMYMYIYIYVCMYVCMHVCMHTPTHTSG